MKTKTFKLHWLNGNTELIYGTSIADAFMNAGYGRGVLVLVDYYEEVND